MGIGKNGAVLSQNNSKESCLSSILLKATSKNSSWPDKDEFLDVVYWARQFLGLILGFIWGIFSLKGFFGLFLFCLINAAVIYFYATNFQNIDEEEYGGLWEITKEGFVTSFAGFLVMWIIIYSAFHFD